MTTRKSLMTSKKMLEGVKTQELEMARSAKSSNVAVVEGEHDHIQEILDAAEIPYEMYGSVDEAVESEPTVVFLNCSSEYESDDCGKLLKKYVEKGGRMVTTDWSLYAFMKAFPGYVKKGPEDVPDKTFRVSPANDLGAKLLGANVVKQNPEWWFEDASYTAIRSNGDKPLIPLIVSEDLKKKYDTDLVAFGVRHGKGEAVHFCSHVYAQKIKGGMEAIATDFTAMHTVLMLCGRAPVLYDYTGGSGNSMLLRTTTGKKSGGLI